MPTHLPDALKSITWVENVEAFLADTPTVAAVENANLRTAIWAKQLECADVGNPALSFVREMQTAAQQSAALIALGLYKASAASMRSMAEAGLYYTYFRNHRLELATLVREKDYYVDKAKILDFHKIHTPKFVLLQDKLGLLSRIENWYSAISAIVHGQVPGVWSSHTVLSAIKNVPELEKEAVKKLIEGEDILHRLFLCMSGRELWDAFSPGAKKRLLAGMSGPEKLVLALDPA